MDQNPLTSSAAARYSALEQDRNAVLDRARTCAALTIPAVMPPQGFSASSQLPTPYQSLGARGARTLASKLLLALFPPNVPFFQYKVDDQTLEDLGEARGEIEKAFARRERAVTTELDAAVFRPVAFNALLHTVVTGNALLYIPPDIDEKAQMWRLDQYVVRRDLSGAVLEIIIKEGVDYVSLDPAIQAEIAMTDTAKNFNPADLKSTPMELYTHIYLDNEEGKWVVYQEIAGIRLEANSGTFAKDELPYLPLRFSYQPSEHYGRAYVEEFLGDLDSLEALSETLVDGSAASARVIFLVNPSGTTSLKVVSEAKNGAVVSGDAADVTAMQVQKASDLSVAKSTAEEIANRLAYAFLLHSAIQRSGERVTAEEIKTMAADLDASLGGVYTLFAAELQLPSVRMFEARMTRRLKVPDLPDKTVKPVLIGGLQAIGRGNDQANLRAFAADILQTLGPEMAAKLINGIEYVTRAAASYGIDPNGLVATQEELDAAAQREQQMMMLQQLGPQAIQAMGGVAKEGAKAAAAPPPQG